MSGPKDGVFTCSCIKHHACSYPSGRCPQTCTQARILQLHDLPTCRIRVPDCIRQSLSAPNGPCKSVHAASVDDVYNLTVETCGKAASAVAEFTRTADQIMQTAIPTIQRLPQSRSSNSFPTAIGPQEGHANHTHMQRPYQPRSLKAEKASSPR